MAWQLGTPIFTREEIIRFAKAYDPQPFHVER
jgi:acyl dehydratase